MNSRLDEIFEKNGPYKELRSVTREEVNPYRGRIPRLLEELWDDRGLGVWKQGRLRIHLPGDLRPLLSRIFKSDKDFADSDCYVYASSAFGTLYFWSERHWSGTIELISGQVVCAGLTKPERMRNPETNFGLSIFDPPKDTLDWFDEEQKPLYARASKALGHPASDECFGFFPALALGGAPNLANLRKVSALEHFAILAQMQIFTLYDYLAQPIQAVRPIG